MKSKNKNQKMNKEMKELNKVPQFDKIRDHG
jgi:hypothetical protein